MGIQRFFILLIYFIHFILVNITPTCQCSEFALAVGKCRGFCRGVVSMFFSICLGKKNANAIEFLGPIRKGAETEQTKYKGSTALNIGNEISAQ